MRNACTRVSGVVGLLLVAAGCADVSGRQENPPHAGEWEAAGAGLAPLSTPCTLDALKTFTITLKDGETALPSLGAIRRHAKKTATAERMAVRLIASQEPTYRCHRC